MNIARLKNFTEIVKNNFNISATAEKLYTSQPTLSKQMKMLEEELGLALFTRKGKNLAGLTPMGGAGDGAGQGGGGPGRTDWPALPR